VTLTFDPKSIGVMTNHHTKFEVLRFKHSLVIDRKQFFTYKVNMTLTFHPKINRRHLLVMTNHHTKFEVPRSKRSLVIDRKLFLPTRSM
jgi:hypothetical protein